MQSGAADVASYLSEVPDERREVLTRLRELCLRVLVGYKEGMECGGPTYKKNGTIEVGFASQKNYISLYVLKKTVVDEYRSKLGTSNIGKGCIRYSSPKKVDLAVIEQLLIATRESKEEVCS